MAIVAIRDFRSDDARAVNRLAVAAFEQYAAHYDDWAAFAKQLAAMADLSRAGELIVAEADGRLVGAVVYVGPGRPKNAFYDPRWAVMRMLVVDPRARGAGFGRRLTQACIDRAQRDDAFGLALHTAGIMEIALAMYLRMGFAFVHDVPPIHGVPYGVYLKRLDA